MIIRYDDLYGIVLLHTLKLNVSFHCDTPVTSQCI